MYDVCSAYVMRGSLWWQEAQQISRYNQRMVEKTLQQHGLERKRLPKVIRAEAKVRTQAFKKALRMGDNSVSIEAVFFIIIRIILFYPR